MAARYVRTVSAKRLPLQLAVCAALLIVLHIVAMTIMWEGWIAGLEYWQVNIFDLDAEDAFGTFLACILLLICGQLVLHQWRYVSSKGDSWAPWWLILAIGFHLFALDEVATMHEWSQSMLQRALDDESVRWTHWGIPIAVFGFVMFIPWLLHLPPRTRFYFILGGVLYGAGTLGIEKATDWYETADLLETTQYHLWIAVEEGLEMAGPIVFLRGLLLHMAGGADDSIEVGTKIEA